ncbi:MAG: terpene cyclase/mutase family protein [Planctomycetes bacterium]|nr:terpene cyclase/mutase family protein [Planctomycetota bacterium]
MSGQVLMDSDSFDALNDDELAHSREDEENASLASALSAEFGAAPWYLSSVAVHAVLFLILLMIPVDPPRQEERRVVIQTEMVEEVEEEELQEPEPDVKEEDPEVVVDAEVTVDTPVVTTTDVEISDNFETDDNMDDNTALGDPDSFSDVDSEFVGTPALMGVGASGGKGGGGRFGFRNGGGRRNAVRRGGGSRRTENSVDWALRWLAAHQESDGHWDVAKYGGKGWNSHDKDTQIGCAGLAILAFLGAGNSTKFGKFRSNVKSAVDWLIKQQKSNGCFGSEHGYQPAMATMAIVEAYGMSSEGRLKEAAQKAVDYVVSSQATDGSWDYKPNSKRSDLSVSGWYIMALKSAKVAGLNAKHDAYEKALSFVDHMTSDNGVTAYQTEGGKAPAPWGDGHGMTAVSLCCQQFLGHKRNHPKVVATASKTVKDELPVSSKFNFYTWYYQALGIFQTGITSEYWKKFNDPMKNTLVSTQVQLGTFEENKGSWNPDTDPWGPAWGRVGQTALGALMLEVYYRYREVQH